MSEAFSSLESRRARTRKLCRLLSERVGQVASPGLGRLDWVWEAVEEPSTRLLDQLAKWEATGKEEHMDRAKAETLAVLEAWKSAEREYRRQRSARREGVPA
ncbi:MAG: hypothetical protein LAT56_17420 [Wenzhouxiangella sp.]|nr:hypothetical protein [Wenzhouxiangella sp.]